ncbi:MAG: vWA domain-containing protein [Myxococcota bacterium]
MGRTPHALLCLALAGCGAKTGLPVPIDTNCRDVDLSAPTPQVVFAIDRSGSMDFTLEGLPPDDPRRGEEPSRWELMSAALPGSLAGRDVEVGAVFYPTILDNDPNACGGNERLDLAPGEGSVDDLARLFAETDPVGGTPTGSALAVARDYLENVPPDRAPFVVLVTDGAPNCNPDPVVPPPLCRCTSPVTERCDPVLNDAAPLHCLDDTSALEEIAGLRAIGVPVFVLGITQQGDLADVLDGLALAGGRPRAEGARRFYDAQTEAELAEAFDAINDSITNCVFSLSAPPPEPGALRVSINGEAVPVTAESGWRFANEDQTIITLFGAACIAAEQPDAEVSADLFCERDDV